MDQDEQEYFEYSLNVPTVVKKNDTTVFYMDRAKWYQFKVRLDNEKMIAHLKKLYFRVQLDYVNENLLQKREQLFDRWHELHPGERLLDIDTNQLKNGKMIYSQDNVNIVRLVTDSAEEMQFSLRINCVHSQFTFENQEFDSNLSDQSVFYLIFTVFSSDGSTVLDTNLCQIKTFWTGLAEPNFEIYRCRLMDTNPNVACEQKFKLLETILNSNSSEINENDSENVSSSTVSIKNKNKRNKFLTLDDREFVCLFQARSNQLGEILLEKGKEYILSIETLNFARHGKKICVSISMEFEQDEFAKTLSNWSLKNQRNTLIECNLVSSQLENSVLDVHQESLYSIKLIWIPEDKIKLALKFNFLSNEFADMNLSSKLVVETSLFNANYKIEKSICLIAVLETAESENDSTTILSNQSFSQKRTILTNVETIDEVVQVNDEYNSKMLDLIENFKTQQKIWIFWFIVVFAIIAACLIKQTQLEVEKANIESKQIHGLLIETKTNLNNAVNTIKFLKNNPVPIGFIYCQLPHQSAPLNLWPNLNWKDVTSEYAGLFFRAGGGGSAKFGYIQEENAPRVTNVVLGRHPQTENGKPWTQTELIVGNVSSGIGIFAGFDLWNSHGYTHSFYQSGGEIRPRNLAMLFWKRIG